MRGKRDPFPRPSLLKLLSFQSVTSDGVVTESKVPLVSGA